jgi:hypothetical protein
VGIRVATKGSWGSRVGSVFIGLYGLGGILVGIFPTDEVDAAGSIEIAFDFVILSSDGPGAELKNAYIPPLPKSSGTSSKLPVGSSRLRFIPSARAASSQSLRS